VQRVAVDTTVMEKNSAYPTDARLYERERAHLVALEQEVAQISLWLNFPCLWTASCHVLRDRGSEGREAVQDRGADLDLCNLAVEVA
jgi:hypothetical protein